MSLMDKFSAVEIKAENRISEEDKAFCLRQQEAFDKSGVSLQKLADLMATVVAEQKAIFANKDDEIGGYLASRNNTTCNVEGVYEVMKSRNETLIDNIVHYFASKYTVDLDGRVIREHLIPAKPKEPDFPGYYRSMSDEEIEEYKAKMKVHKAEQDSWEQTLRTLPLRYEQIVDEIFVQLGGFSFQEQAMNEFLERSWNCCHKTWGDQSERFEIKNDILRLTGGWCYCDDGWSWGPEWKPSDDLKTLLDALAWYECGRMGEGYLWFKDICGYSTKQNEFDIRNMEKVKFIKLFKNGRVDIKFRSAAYVQEFAEQCLRRRPSSAA